MFKQILFTQWRWTRTLLVAMTVLAFLAPAIAWWMGGVRAVYPERPAALIAGFESVRGLLILIASLGSFLLAAYPWMMDAASRHVFALSLPIKRREYLAMRFGAGALMLLAPTIALYVGSLAALAFLELPATLRAYPGALAIRFLSATLVAYSLTFAIQHLAGRKAAVILVGGIAGFAALLFVMSVLGFGGVSGSIMSALFDMPGPFAVFAADWKLLDV